MLSVVFITTTSLLGFTCGLAAPAGCTPVKGTQACVAAQGRSLANFYPTGYYDDGSGCGAGLQKPGDITSAPSCSQVPPESVTFFIWQRGCQCPPGTTVLVAQCYWEVPYWMMCGTVLALASPAPTITASSASTVATTASPLMAAARGDPHLVSLTGQPQEFAGIASQAFNVWSSPSDQINFRLASFGFQDATFIHAVGIKSLIKSTKLLVETPEQCCNTSNVPLQVQLQGRTVAPNTSYSGDGLTVQYWTNALGSHVTVELPAIAVLITRGGNACHLDLGLQVLDVRDADAVHGLLGQGLACATGKQARCSWEGDEAAYMVSNLFEDDFAFNKFMGDQMHSRPGDLLQDTSNATVATSSRRSGRFLVTGRAAGPDKTEVDHVVHVSGLSANMWL